MEFLSKIKMDYVKLNSCLACGSDDLELVLNLNDQPLANAFLKHQHEPEPTFPLAVNLCKHCCHLQLTHAVDPKLIYTHYLYVSGTSRTQHDYMSWFAKFASEYFDGQPSTVLDIGCNDGTQLNYFKELGVKTYGIDPAQNLFATSSQQHHVVCDFFNANTAKLFVEQYGQVDCVVAQNSFAHNPDPLGYLTALKEVLTEHGLFFIQTSQADMVLNNEFDTIYHEHVNFYNINSMKALCDRAGYNLVDVIKTPIHGTSYVFVLSPGIAKPGRIANLLEIERQAGLENINTYRKWAENVMFVVGQFCNLCQVFKYQQGYKLVGYGAAAKGNTLLNFAQLDLDMIIDDNPLKQGLLSPGRHIPVVGIEALDAIPASQPVMFVPLAWNFYSEIREKILARRRVERDRFIKYFPEVRVE
jgi:SAM-dependent methyltransferase